MRLTVLGGCGAWPAAGQACSGYLLEAAGFRLLVDPGYAVVPRLLTMLDAAEIDAVVVSHGHADHCADLNPLLRARALRADPAPPLPVYALRGALDAVLQLDRDMLHVRRHTCDVTDLEPGRLSLGPFAVTTRLLPHSLPNLGMRIEAEGMAVAYTGDSAPDAGVVELARSADVLLIDASTVDPPADGEPILLGNARDAGRQASAAGVGRLVLTHLLPETDSGAAYSAARAAFGGPIDLGTQGLVV